MEARSRSRPLSARAPRADRHGVRGPTAFLYSGTNPIQTGVAPGAIEARRAAVVRGRVPTRDGLALSGVTIRVLGHPELGETVQPGAGSRRTGEGRVWGYSVEAKASGLTEQRRTAPSGLTTVQARAGTSR